VTDAAQLAAVAEWIRATDRLVALTGAGVSTASGIPDFRGPQGLWTRDPGAERLASIDAYVEDPQVRREVWKWRMETLEGGYEPNPAHHALAELQRRGHLHTLVTQNVDGLHQAAGSDPDRLVEIHGTIHEVVCLSCGDRRPMSEILQRLHAGEDDPDCQRCGGLLKSATISFGQSLDPATLQRAHDATMGSEVFLAIGSSLIVHPVALLPRTALEVGAKLVVVNAEPTPYDDRADAVFHADVGEVLQGIVERL
jgi:NAD-dependent deacetylase